MSDDDTPARVAQQSQATKQPDPEAIVEFGDVDAEFRQLVAETLETSEFLSTELLGSEDPVLIVEEADRDG
ncbi:hypothetical protein ACFQL1_23765 [Halomicroarcula sp. GCM10025709]|uniref:hypothetical protein n=1 Tax=Haloarcula TaxID=2237 RepID=UPI0024C366CD|nr:hypothetical protein [Halomicroarcula sp. YJ-61-S]